MYVMYVWCIVCPAQSGSSSKRGIKTMHSGLASYIFFMPRVGHPAKEGLRLSCFICVPFMAVAQSGSSSKRGIKTSFLFYPSNLIHTQSGSSSKRGIKTSFSTTLRSGQTPPRVGHPAKEGLRPNKINIILFITYPEWVIQQKRD